MTTSATLENLLAGLSRAVSTNPADTSANDALSGSSSPNCPILSSNNLLFSLDGNTIGTSMDSAVGRLHGGDRAYFQGVLAGQRLSIGDVVRGRLTAEWGPHRRLSGGRSRGVDCGRSRHWHEARTIPGRPEDPRTSRGQRGEDRQ